MEGEVEREQTGVSRNSDAARLGLPTGRRPDPLTRSTIPRHAQDEAQRTGVFRSYRVWALDVAKQDVSAGCAHGAGILNAKILASRQGAEGSDECSWYFISFTLDTTVGVALGYLVFTLTTRVAVKCNWVSLQRSGDYRDIDGNIDYWIWSKQMVVWCLITIAARFMVLGLQLLGYAAVHLDSIHPHIGIHTLISLPPPTFAASIFW